MHSRDFAFRPLRDEEVPLIVAWCREPHALRWFGRGRSDAEIAAEYEAYLAGDEPVAAYALTLAGRPVGLFNWERLDDFPDVQLAYGVEDPDAANMDVLLGDPAVAGRGLGAPLVRRFAEEIVFADPRITSIVIDPHAENRIAIRAYEKAGFRFLREVLDPEDGVMLHLMLLPR